MGKAGEDAEPVERAAKERQVGVQPDEADRSQGLQPDFVKRGGEIIGPGPRTELAEAVGEDNRELALGAEVADRIARLLAGGKPQLVLAKPGIEPLDAWVVAGALERIEKVAQCLLAAENQLR